MEGVHYGRSTIASSIKNDTSIKIIKVFDLMDGWVESIIDLKVACLHGEFEEDGEPNYTEVPVGFKKFYRA